MIRVVITIPSLFYVLVVLMLTGCSNDDGVPAFEADFNFSYVNDNLVRYENSSLGEYYSLIWDFGNGERVETTEKSKAYDVAYPVAGDYVVSLMLLDFVGNTKSKSKTVSISNTSFSISFSAEINADNPNIVTLTNSSQGDFDSYKWVFRGVEIENTNNYEAYFPFTGNYDIELVVQKDGISHSETKSVNIISDDENYIDHLDLVWSDEFEGSALNTDSWTYESGASGWGNNELQNYTSGNNAKVENGLLTITAEKVDENSTVGSYTSSRIISKVKEEFQYGRFEIRAKLPSGRGIWPAIWMLGSNFGTAGWPTCGEIDIMEYVGYAPNIVHATIHTSSGFGSSGNGTSIPLESCEEEFHTYGLLWTMNKIQFYIDDPTNITHTYNPSNKTLENWPFDQPAFFILNIAVGGDWGGAQGVDNSIFPQTMDIDYVRVYQEKF